MIQRRKIKRLVKIFYAAILIVFNISCSNDSILQYNVDRPLNLKEWEFRWGDFPSDSSSNVQWSQIDTASVKWQNLSCLDEIPDPGFNKIIWLKTKLPQWKGYSPALFISRAQEVFEVYLDTVKIYENYNFTERENLLVVSGNWYLIELPDICSGRTIYFRMHSDSRGIGFPPPIQLGSTLTFIEKLFSDHIVEFVIGFAIVILAFITLVIFIVKEMTFYNLGVSVFFFAIGFFILGCTPLTQLVFPSLKLTYYAYNLSFFFEAFLYLIIEKVAIQKYKKMFRWLWGIHFTYFIVAMVVVLTTGVTLEDVIEPFIIILASTGSFSLLILLKYSMGVKTETKILLVGILVFLICGLSETIIYYENILSNNYYLGFTVFHFGGFWFVGSIVTLYGYKYYDRVKQKEIAQQQALEHQSIAYEALERTKAAQEYFSHRLIENQDDEQRRISLELHDAIGQELLIIKNMSMLSLRDESLNPKVKDLIEDISQSAGIVIEDVRSISRNLYPYQLENLGLTKSLIAILEKSEKATLIKFNSNIDDINGLLDKDSEIHVYRILQECISNILKHSKATNATINLLIKDYSIVMTFEDDGTGFSLEYLKSGGYISEGYGLPGMQERVKILKGKLVIHSIIDSGTKIEITIPIKK